MIKLRTLDGFTWNILYIPLKEHNNPHILQCMAPTHALSPPSPCKLTEYQSGKRIASQFPTHGLLLGPLLSSVPLLPHCGKGVLRTGTLFICLKFLKCWCIITYSLGVMRYIPSVSALVVRSIHMFMQWLEAGRIGSSVEGVELRL